MLTAKNLPSAMCPSCKFYNYAAGDSQPHRCSESGSFNNFSKLNCDPDRTGTAPQCRAFKSR